MHKIICIGGGTGMFALLSGLKTEFPEAHVSAVVSMMDSGGSTGRLRDDFGHLPPGDVRKCLVALSNAPHRLRRLMEYRFETGDVKGHTMGNLMLTALKESLPGDTNEKEYGAIVAMEDILNIHGNVYPVTLTNCHLKATLSDGTVIRGETNIDVPKHNAMLHIDKLELEPQASIFAKTKEAIEQADTIIIGPGDLYTSLLPNLIVDGMVDAMKTAKQNGARIVYVVSTMTKFGETNEYTASKFVNTIQTVLDGAKIDTVIVNDGEISGQQRDAYAAEKSHPVLNDMVQSEYDVIVADVVNRETFARHHPERLAEQIKRIIEG